MSGPVTAPAARTRLSTELFARSWLKTVLSEVPESDPLVAAAYAPAFSAKKIATSPRTFCLRYLLTEPTGPSLIVFSFPATRGRNATDMCGARPRPICPRRALGAGEAAPSCGRGLLVQLDLLALGGLE